MSPRVFDSMQIYFKTNGFGLNKVNWKLLVYKMR